MDLDERLEHHQRIGFYGTKGVPDPANVPGAREFMATWIDDNGDFWLFGGFGFDGVGTSAT